MDKRQRQRKNTKWGLALTALLLFFCILGVCIFLLLQIAGDGQKKAEQTEPLSTIQTVWTGQEQNLDKALMENEAAAVRVITQRQQGSGVCFAAAGGNLRIVTCAHVLDGETQGKVIFSDGAEHGFVCAAADTERDVAVLEVSLTDMAQETREAVRLVSTGGACYKRLTQEDEIGLIGFDEGRRTEITGNVIANGWFLADFGMEMLYIKCSAKPGMSGGGLFDSHGHYVGMLSGGTEEEGAGIPLPVIEEVVRGAG